MVGTLALDRADFDALGRGDGDVSTLRKLRDGQLSKRLAMLTLFIDQASVDTGRWARSGMGDVVDVLQEIEAADPEAVRSTLLYPYVGEWLAQCRGAARADGTDALLSHMRYLGNVTAACALTTAFSCTLPVSMVNGKVSLPGIGVAVLGSEVPGSEVSDIGMETLGSSLGDVATMIVSGDRNVRVEALISAGNCSVAISSLDQTGRDTQSDGDRRSGSEGVGWLPLRRIEAISEGLEISLIVDDLDPFRGGHGLNIADRVDDAAIVAWQKVLRDGWEILVRRHRQRAEVLAEGLVCIAPIEVDEKGTGANATSMNAFGALSMSWPYDGSNFAVALVHEFQHGKLGALLDLVPLCVSDSSKRFYAPWRGDPRPLGGLLQGAYAYVGVTDFWNVERHVVQKVQSYAHVEFARWREQVGRAIDVLATSGQLTDEGVAFIGELRSRCDEWREVEVPEGLADTAFELAVDHEMMWRLRNLAVDDRVVEALSRAWREGIPAADGVADGAADGAAEGATMRMTGRILEVTSRHDLLARKLSAPDGSFDAQCVRLHDSGDTRSGSAADLAYVDADYEAAGQLYVGRIEADPTDMDAWAGLALSLRRADRFSLEALWSRPEVVAALYRALLAEGATVSPLDLARWLT